MSSPFPSKTPPPPTSNVCDLAKQMADRYHAAQSEYDEKQADGSTPVSQQGSSPCTFAELQKQKQAAKALELEKTTATATKQSLGSHSSVIIPLKEKEKEKETDHAAEAAAIIKTMAADDAALKQQREERRNTVLSIKRAAQEEQPSKRPLNIVQKGSSRPIGASANDVAAPTDKKEPQQPVEKQQKLSRKQKSLRYKAELEHLRAERAAKAKNDKERQEIAAGKERDMSDVPAPEKVVAKKASATASENAGPAKAQQTTGGDGKVTKPSTTGPKKTNSAPAALSPQQVAEKKPLGVTKIVRPERSTAPEMEESVSQSDETRAAEAEHQRLRRERNRHIVETSLGSRANRGQRIMTPAEKRREDARHHAQLRAARRGLKHEVLFADKQAEQDFTKATTDTGSEPRKNEEPSSEKNSVECSTSTMKSSIPHSFEGDYETNRYVADDYSGDSLAKALVGSSSKDDPAERMLKKCRKHFYEVSVEKVKDERPDLKKITKSDMPHAIIGQYNEVRDDKSWLYSRFVFWFRIIGFVSMVWIVLWDLLFCPEAAKTAPKHPVSNELPRSVLKKLAMKDFAQRPTSLIGIVRLYTEMTHVEFFIKLFDVIVNSLPALILFHFLFFVRVFCAGTTLLLEGFIQLRELFFYARAETMITYDTMKYKRMYVPGKFLLPGRMFFYRRDPRFDVEVNVALLERAKRQNADHSTSLIPLKLKDKDYYHHSIVGLLGDSTAMYHFIKMLTQCNVLTKFEPFRTTDDVNVPPKNPDYNKGKIELFQKLDEPIVDRAGSVPALQMGNLNKVVIPTISKDTLECGKDKRIAVKPAPALTPEQYNIMSDVLRNLQAETVRADLESNDIVEYAIDYVRRKRLTKKKGENVITRAKELARETDDKRLEILREALNKTGFFIKDECYTDSKKPSVRYIIDPVMDVKLIFGAALRPVEESIYHHSRLTEHLIKSRNPTDTLAMFVERFGDNGVYVETDYSSFEANIRSEELAVEFDYYKHVAGNAPRRHAIFDIVRTFHQRTNKVFHSFSLGRLVVDDMRLSGFPNTALGNAILNYANIALAVGGDDQVMDFLVEGDDSIIKFETDEEADAFLTNLNKLRFPAHDTEKFHRGTDASFCGMKFTDGAIVPTDDQINKLSILFCRKIPSDAKILSLSAARLCGMYIKYPGYKPELDILTQRLKLAFSDTGFKFHTSDAIAALTRDYRLSENEEMMSQAITLLHRLLNGEF